MYIATNLGAQISDETFGKKYLFGPNRQKMGPQDSPTAGRFFGRFFEIDGFCSRRSVKRSLGGWNWATEPPFPPEVGEGFRYGRHDPLEKVATTRSFFVYARNPSQII